jgi:hypothetical protein
MVQTADFNAELKGRDASDTFQSLHDFTGLYPPLDEMELEVKERVNTFNRRNRMY